MVVIIIERHVKEQNYPKLMENLVVLRSIAYRQKGYIDGKVILRKDRDGIFEVLTICNWKSEEYWKGWLQNEEGIKIENALENILEKPVKTRLFELFGKAEEARIRDDSTGISACPW